MGLVTSSYLSLLCIRSDGSADIIPVSTLLLSRYGHDDIIIPIATMHVYKEPDIVPPSSSSDRSQCES
jgi:hypothetical protein